MLLPDMFDSSGGPPGKYCHTGIGPSAHIYHNPSGLKIKIFLHINANPDRGFVIAPEFLLFFLNFSYLRKKWKSYFINVLD
jgi:hypothetical protein